MKTKRGLCLAVVATTVLASIAFQLHATPAKDAAVWRSNGRVMGWNYVAYVFAVAQLNKAPRWDGKGEPPLSEQKAVEAAQAEAQRAFKDVKLPKNEGWKARKVELMGIEPRSFYKDQWIYVVALELQQTMPKVEENGEPIVITVPVTLDGKASEISLRKVPVKRKQ